MDSITLKGMRLYGFHGVYPLEKEMGRYFEVDAELFLPLDKAAASDDLKQSVNYAQVFDFIKAEFTKKACDLIETTAISLAKAVLSNFPVEKVIIRVRKPEPPVEGHVDYAQVQIERSRQ